MSQRHRSQNPRHRGLQERPGDRGAGEAGRCGGQGGSARLAGIRQGDDGSAVARSRRREGVQGQGRRQGFGRLGGPDARCGRRRGRGARSLPRASGGNPARARRRRRRKPKPRRPAPAKADLRAVPGGRQRHRATPPRRSRREERGRRRLRARAREPGGAPFRARAGRRSRPSQGHRPRRAHPQGGRAEPRQGGARAPAARRRRRPGVQPAAARPGGFREVRPGGDEAALAHQEALGSVPASQLGNDSARHATRRGGYHRARGVSQVAGRGGEEERHQVHDARLPAESVGGGVAGSFPISIRRCRPMARACSSRATITSAWRSTRRTASWCR